MNTKYFTEANSKTRTQQRHHHQMPKTSKTAHSTTNKVQSTSCHKTQVYIKPGANQLETCLDNKQYPTQTWREQRAKYTVIMRRRKPGVQVNKTKQMEMKGGVAMARRPVTSTAERCPNKERDRQ